MDDLEDLQARVAAAQEKLRLNADDQRKYGLRLNDVVTIVEGSLARQQAEMKRLQDAAMTLRLECDAARVAENQSKSLYDAALARLNLLQAQNEQLRSMVMTLLNVIEGREAPSALQAVVQRLESTVHETQPTTQLSPLPARVADDASAEEPANAAAADTDAEDNVSAEAETVALGEHEQREEPAEEDAASPAAELTAEAGVAEAAETPREEAMAGAEEEASDTVAAFDGAAGAEGAVEGDTSAEMIDAVDEDLEADSSDIAAAAADMPEDLEEISMNGHREFVTDADEIVANEALVDAVVAPEPVEAKAQPASQQDETLVSALLDAEKALIEAGASGVANANSPVAEIIRRISLRTREFSEASGV